MIHLLDVVVVMIGLGLIFGAGHLSGRLWERDRRGRGFDRAVEDFQTWVATSSDDEFLEAMGQGLSNYANHHGIYHPGFIDLEVPTRLDIYDQDRHPESKEGGE